MCICLSDMRKGQKCMNIFVFQSNIGFVLCLLPISEMLCRKKKLKPQMLLKMVNTY